MLIPSSALIQVRQISVSQTALQKSWNFGHVAQSFPSLERSWNLEFFSFSNSVLSTGKAMVSPCMLIQRTAFAFKSSQGRVLTYQHSHSGKEESQYMVYAHRKVTMLDTQSNLFFPYLGSWKFLIMWDCTKGKDYGKMEPQILQPASVWLVLLSLVIESSQLIS